MINRTASIFSSLLIAGVISGPAGAGLIPSTAQGRHDAASRLVGSVGALDDLRIVTMNADTSDDIRRLPEALTMHDIPGVDPFEMRSLDTLLPGDRVPSVSLVELVSPRPGHGRVSTPLSLGHVATP